MPTTTPIIGWPSTMCFVTFLLLFLFVQVGRAGKPTNLKFYTLSEITYWGCTAEALVEAQWSETPYDYTPFCTDINAMATLVGCFSYKGRNTTQGLKFFFEKCEQEYFTTVTWQNITESYQLLLDKGLSVEEMGNYTYGDPVTHPIILDQTASLLQIKAENVFLQNYNHSVYYGAGLIAYWGLICVISGLANWSLVLFPRLGRTCDGKISRMWRKYVLLPALFRKKNATQQNFLRVFSFLVPSRIETIVLFIFFWLLFGLCAAEIHYLKGDPVFALKLEAIDRYVADRTGIMSLMLLPLLILFGGRNNFLLWVTRWKYSRFITYHRWIARMCVLLATIHSICYFRSFVIYDDMAEETGETYVKWGIVAFACGILIMFQGLLVLRRACYELFLVLHIVLAAFFVIGTWYHVYELEYSQFLYAVFAVWAFDRIFRVVRVVLFGFPKADVAVYSDDTMKVTIKRPSHWKPTPGGHAFVYFLHKYYFWQSHPFSYVEDGEYLLFFCKVKGGVTKSIYKSLANLPGKAAQMTVSVEGPYGESHPIKNHSDVHFVASGNGIAGLLSEFRYLEKAGATRQRLKLTWVVREIKSLSWLYKELQSFRNTESLITIYITRPDLVEGIEDLCSLMSICEDSGKELKEAEPFDDIIERLNQELPHVNFVAGRPDLQQIVQTDVNEAAHSVAFVSCGHPIMVDDLRYRVVQVIDQTNKTIDFYDTMEIWA